MWSNTFASILMARLQGGANPPPAKRPRIDTGGKTDGDETETDETVPDADARTLFGKMENWYKLRVMLDDIDHILTDMQNLVSATLSESTDLSFFQKRIDDYRKQIAPMNDETYELHKNALADLKTQVMKLKNSHSMNRLRARKARQEQEIAEAAERRRKEDEEKKQRMANKKKQLNQLIERGREQENNLITLLATHALKSETEQELDNAIRMFEGFLRSE